MQATWRTLLVVAIAAAPAPAQWVSQPTPTPIAADLAPSPLPAAADPVPPAAPALPALPAPAEPAAAARVEPGRHLFEFRGSGIHGPYHHDESDRWIDFGIIVQAEYLHNSISGSPDSQFLFFRRLRPILMGGMDDWQGILMVDFGAGQNGDNYQTSVRWADIEYTGFDQAIARFGSFKPWFSRELLTIGPHLQTVERSPVGDTNYGNPDYMIGAAWDQMLEGRTVAYYASVGLEDHAQQATQMQMRSPAYAPGGSNQGVLVTGRVDLYPVGDIPYDPRPLHTPPQLAYNRGDFHADDWRVIVSAAGYGWWNDGTSNPFTMNGVSTSTTQADLDRAYGAEVSGGVRGHGFSADAEYQYVRGDLVAPAFTGGLYVNGRTNLNKFAVNGGYMLPYNVEPVAGWAIVDATGFTKGLTETKFGLNWYVLKFAVRFAADYAFINNNNGTPGSNMGVTRATAQFVW